MTGWFVYLIRLRYCATCVITILSLLGPCELDDASVAERLRPERLALTFAIITLIVDVLVVLITGYSEVKHVLRLIRGELFCQTR